MKTDHFTLLTCSSIADNNSTRQQEGNKYNLDFFLKNWRMRILSAVFFPSLLAGNFATFERILLTEKLMHEY